MSSILSSGWYTCKGCFQCMKWDNDEVEAHLSICKDYQKEMKRILALSEKQKEKKNNK